MVRQLVSSVLDLVYPRRCAGCRRIGAWICEVCLGQCAPHGRACCRRCGSRVGSLPCATCERYIRHLTELRAAYEYGGPVRDLVHRFKYGGLHSAASWMAEQMPVERLPRTAVLVPVPLHPARQKERGYNQSELLARALGRRTELPVLSALRRVRYTQPQSHQDAASRWVNIRGAFEPRQELDRGSVAVLIDDVCTTGATLEECASVLGQMGAERVVALVFARA